MAHHPLSAGSILFHHHKPTVIAVIGCGGKTTFIHKLAEECQQKKVLITPTTKMKPWDNEWIQLCTTLEDCDQHQATIGVQCLGIQNNVTHKLEALPITLLQEIISHYDIALLEADGSRGLPCKGWLHNEPVIPSFCTDTVAIVTLTSLNKPATKDSILRIPEFLQLTGLSYGDRITIDTLTMMICSDGGMLKNTVGERYLFINQVECDADIPLAKQFIASIQQSCKDPIRSFYGSAIRNQWREYYASSS
ncbi:selenium cofactor biosynthesis protein YqeC (plasmid) [Entomospira entomophila]|uniref:Selenium-dependent hydroxylase accessory protein YqeC n=1 Tax=Entomospira entomophila TaxID=2719988 RepID=A0A968GD83_9SPIO|nr:selenium cofactor biosynthesis protein YqeC [Entomospira entomophilus]NIZ41321.1 putative selenium-dependent hydroxylase accessory protein YqeC [Entomospira entomophilus]WDI36267.1 selenium cofactor biosynthesis protein YqeC [Entomospira entomophilus]